MVKIILNRLEPQAEKIIVEEQAGVRAGRSITEQIFNLRILCEKYLQHQQDLYHVFIDFKKAFDRVWHAGLWATMKKYNINANLKRVIKNLSDKAINAVLFKNSVGDWFEQQLESNRDVYSHPPSSTYSRKDHDRCLRRSERHCQHWRQNNYQSPLC